MPKSCRRSSNSPSPGTVEAGPYNTDRAGRRYGARSAYSRPRGRSPICYEQRDRADELREQITNTGLAGTVVDYLISLKYRSMRQLIEADPEVILVDIGECTEF